MRLPPSLALLVLQVALARANGCMTVEQCPELAKLETSECQTYHMFSVRGSTAPYPGHQSDLMKLVCDGLEGSCGFENVVYPAANGNPGWCDSAHEGALNQQKQMTEYAQKCPDSKLIVIGYSQGGSVALDAIGGGGGGQIFGCTQEVNQGLDRKSSPGSHVVAIASFGPTVRSPGQNYTTLGGEKYRGQAERSSEQLAALDTYAADGILREWCQPGDPICAADSEPHDVQKHLNYFDNYNDEAAKWIIRTANGSSSTISSAKAAATSAAISVASAINLKHVIAFGAVVVLL